MKKGRWTEEELEKLNALLKEGMYEWMIAVIMDRSSRSIREKKRSLGLKRTPYSDRSHVRHRMNEKKRIERNRSLARLNKICELAREISLRKNEILEIFQGEGNEMKARIDLRNDG